MPARIPKPLSATLVCIVLAAPLAAGEILGRVTYGGADGDVEVALDADPVCASLHDSAVETESIVSVDGGLGNVLIRVTNAPAAHQTPEQPVVLEQIGCTYRPHAAVLRLGQTLTIRNSDPTLHNVRALATINKPFNLAQPFQGMEVERSFDQVEIGIAVRCDVHPWMRSYLHVLDHPYFALTQPDGSFEIEGLADGTYRVEAWHEDLGSRTATVTVTGDRGEVDFDFDDL